MEKNTTKGKGSPEGEQRGKAACPPKQTEKQECVGKASEDVSNITSAGHKNTLSGSTLLEAAEYVEAVMSSQQVSAILRTPMPSGRKRHLSLPAVGESDMKKMKSDNLSVHGEQDESDENSLNDSSDGSDGGINERGFVRARRNLLLSKKGNGTASGSSFETDRILAAMGDLRVGLENKMEDMNRSNSEKFEAMKTEIEKARMDFNNRMEGLAKKVETRVMKSMAKEMDSKLKHMRTGIDKEINKVQKSCESTSNKVLKLKETTLTTMKEELGDELDTLADRLKSLETKVGEYRQDTSTQSSQEEYKRNIVIRNLCERENENVLQRVNNVVLDGLQLKNITIESATRKDNKNNYKPGLIIATCKTVKDKENIMNKKRELKNSRRYENVFIEHDLPSGQRKLNSNLRTIVNTIGQNKLLFKGSRILPAENGHRTDERSNDVNQQGRRREERDSRSHRYDERRSSGSSDDVDRQRRRREENENRYNGGSISGYSNRNHGRSYDNYHTDRERERYERRGRR